MLHLRNLPPGCHADGYGLYIVVDDTGPRRWIWRGRIQRKRCDLGLGSFPLVSLGEAREKAFAIRKKARDGENVLAERRQNRKLVPTFKAAAIEVHAEHSKNFKNAKHKAQWLNSLENDVFETLGARPVNTITSGDILTVLTPIWTTKPETARRLKQRIALVFDWAKAKNYCTGDNPTDGVTEVLPKHAPSQAHHAALPFARVPQFVTDLRAHGDTDELIKLALELGILTATRTNEILAARMVVDVHDKKRLKPDIFDLDAKVWTIPAHRMKKNREHRIPLADRAVEIVERILVLRDPKSSWLLPGKKPGKPFSNMTLLKAARRVRPDVELTVHGFRSSFRDWCEERTSTPHSVVDAALAHVVKDKTDAAYRRTDLFDRRRTLMDLWAQFVTGATAKVLIHSA